MIKGKKIGLRAIEQSDLGQLRDWRNIPELRGNFREYRELSLSDQQRWFERLQNDSRNLMFLIELLGQDKPLGVCGLTNLDWRIRSAELSLYIGEQAVYIDDQYAPDAVLVLLDYAFSKLNLNKVWAEVYAFDTLKARLLEKDFAFQRDGVLRANCFAQGRYHDAFILSLLANEWSAGES